MTAPSKYTMRQQQDELHAYAIATIAESSWLAYDSQTLRNIRDSVLNNPRLNPHIVEPIQMILDQRDDHGTM
jgi:hypothetical protein